MAFFWGDAQGAADDEALADEHPQAGLISALAARAGGVGALVIAAALCGALASYDTNDPSLMTATGRDPGNWMGAPGALVADMLVQGLGLAAWAVVALIGAWGWRLAAARGDERIWARMILILPAIGAVSILAALYPPWDGWPIGAGLGGVLGDRAATVLLLSLPVPPAEAALQLTIGMGVIAAILMAAALGITIAEARLATLWLASTSAAVAAPILALVRRAPATITGAVAGRGTPPPPRSETMAPAEPVRMRRMVVEDDPDAVAESAVAEGETRHGRQAVEMVGAAGRRMASFGASLASGLASGLTPARAGPGKDHSSDATQQTGATRTAEPVMMSLAGPDTGGVGAGGTGVGQALRALESGGTGASPMLDRPDYSALDDADAEPPAPPVAAPKRGVPRRSRRAQADAQPSLFDAGLGDDPYEPPTLALLARPVDIQVPQASQAALTENARMLETVLDDYGVRGEIVAVKPGPVVTLYELEPAPGLKASRVIGLADDIARSMSALSARIATVPG
ncbi:MAG: DNA translocase FtsK 4TM domain-containing protein, partial [Pseudomonadota bacterium]